MRRGILLGAGAIGTLALLWVGAFALAATFACSDGERAAYEEFDQYVGDVEPSGNPEVGSCAAYYEAAGSREDVFSYFEDRFEENGWEQRPEEAGQVQGNGEELVQDGLVAYRNGYRYEVLTEEGESSPEAPGGTTHVAAHVYDSW